jgi:hypothetical protein
VDSELRKENFTQHDGCRLKVFDYAEYDGDIIFPYLHVPMPCQLS